MDACKNHPDVFNEAIQYALDLNSKLRRLSSPVYLAINLDGDEPRRLLSRATARLLSLQPIGKYLLEPFLSPSRPVSGVVKNRGADGGRQLREFEARLAHAKGIQDALKATHATEIQQPIERVEHEEADPEPARGNPLPNILWPFLDRSKWGDVQDRYCNLLRL